MEEFVMTTINVIVNLAGLEIHATLVRPFRHRVFILAVPGHVSTGMYKGRLDR